MTLELSEMALGFSSDLESVYSMQSVELYNTEEKVARYEWHKIIVTVYSCSISLTLNSKSGVSLQVCQELHDPQSNVDLKT